MQPVRYILIVIFLIFVLRNHKDKPFKFNDNKLLSLSN